MEDKGGIYIFDHKDVGVIYVGMSEKSVLGRIKNHTKELSFQPYLSGCTAYYYFVPGKRIQQALEALLVGHFQPALNTVLKGDTPYEGPLPIIPWEKYPGELTPMHKDPVKHIQPEEGR